MYWAALRTCTPHSPSPIELSPAQQAWRADVALWALQFTPRVSTLDEAVIIETSASARLYGGIEKLQQRVEAQAKELGVSGIAWAVTALASLALARAGSPGGLHTPLTDLLDGLPWHTLSATLPHAPTLARLGCRTLGDLRGLPRGGVARRFDKALLTALDQAYGLRPEVYTWETIPPTFSARLELAARVETATAMVFGARRLLLQLCAWLAARHAGVSALTLRWRHDAMRARATSAGAELTVRTAEPTDNIDHLSRLLAEHLAHVVLEAPVGELELIALETSPVREVHHSLLHDAERQRTAINQVLERVATRLGPKRVLRAQLYADHRIEWMQRWVAHDAPITRTPAPYPNTPQPSWVLRKPMKLALWNNRPVYQGPLQLVLGPERLQAGWWQQRSASSAQHDALPPSLVQRDYWVALSEQAGVLWIFQQRGPGQFDWYLHGHFA